MKKILKDALTSEVDKFLQLIDHSLYGTDIKDAKAGVFFVIEINNNPNIDSGIEDKIEGDKIYDTIIEWFKV